MFKNNLLLLYVLTLWGTLFTQAQNNIWEDIEESRISLQGERQIIPNQYRTLHLDVENLQTLLAEAPLRFSQEAQNNAIYLELPLYDGSMATFRVEEAPMMEKELANKFPELKTYTAVQVDNPAIKARLDWTIRGFHAMIYSPEGSLFIDPYSTNDVTNYISYHKNDYTRADGDVWKCHANVEEHIIDKKQKSGLLKSVAGDCQLRSYRLAVATTGEYTAFHGGTVAGAMSAITTTMNRVNGIYETEVSVTMVLVANNNQLIYTNSGSDPYSNNDGGAMLGENQTTVDNTIGSANYDIGHVFSTGGGGVAYLGSVCSGSKAGGVTGGGSPVNDPFDVDYVAHEMGHQFGGNHTQNNACNRNNTTAMEPGSGSTIMGYAGICAPNVQNNSDDHFHAISIQEISNFITGGGNSCASIVSTSNTAPVANAGQNYTIPRSTPFTLQGTATDADGDALTSNWDQMDNETSTQSPVATSTDGPNFESITPIASLDRTIPDISYIVNNTNNIWEVLSDVNRTFDFRFTVRDNNAAYGCTDEDDMTVTTSSASGPFLVNSPNTSLSWSVGATETVTWDVANTTAAPVSCANVDILLSLDGGYTYPITLASNVTNDGSHNIVVPNNPNTTSRVKVVCADNIFFDISNTDFTIELTGPDFAIMATPTTLAVCPGDNAVYDIMLDAFGGFNSSVVFATSGLPTGVNANFSSASLTGSGNTNLTLSNTGGLASGTYTITVSATSNGVTKMTTIDLVVGAPTGTASLNNPANGATNEALAPTLSWNTTIGATSYLVQVATDAAFTNIVESSTVSTTSYTVNTLSPLTTYYWNITPINTCGNGGATSFNFETGDLTYCTAQGNSVADEWIETVAIASINNTSGSNGGYQDYTSISTDMDLGATYNATLTPGYAGTNYDEQWRIWIDFNKNGDFTDGGELVYDSGSAQAGVTTGSFTIPNNVPLGTTRMRVSMKYNGGSTSCEAFDFGEVEDYTVVIKTICTDADNDSVCDDVDVCAGGDDTIDTNNNGTPDDCEPARIGVKVFLEGAYDGLGQMRNDLNTKNLLPLQHPYTAAPYNMPAITLGSIPAQMVDWIIVEVRSGTNNTDIVESHVGLLMTNGSVKDTDGISDLLFNLPVGGSYYVVVRHRNHLDVMSSTAVPRSVNMTYDFTTNVAQGFSNKQKALIDGNAAMFTGDNTQDLVIQLTDFDVWKQAPAQLNVYNLADLNMDGVVQTTDYDAWESNKSTLAPTQLAY